MKAVISNPQTKNGVTSIVVSFRGVRDVDGANLKLHAVAGDLSKTLKGQGLFAALSVGIVNNDQVAVIADLHDGASIEYARLLLKAIFDPKVLL